MYALLLLESSVLFWALLRWQADGNRRALGVYGVAAVLGLWTHYFFPVVLAAAGGAFLWGLGRGDRRFPAGQFLAVNFLALLLYLPWLPTAIQRLLRWPGQEGFVGPLAGLGLTLQTLTVGPIRSGPELAWGWLLLAGLLPLIGGWRLRKTAAGSALLLWLLLPVAVMFAFGLFSHAFLKFLLVAAPAWCLLSAAAVAPRGAHAARLPLRIASVAAPAGLALLAVAGAGAALPGYYADPAARDNYAGIARTVAALGDPATDLVLLNAPGQADVWRYYDPGLPVLPLPGQRPPDPGQTEAALAAALAQKRRVFALLWATDQSDPAGIVEGWLGRNGFKGLESWQGNVRFATFSLPHGLGCTRLQPPAPFGEVATLSQICLNRQGLSAGEILLLRLHWQPLTAPDRAYKVTVQLLDGANRVIAQQDGEPGGGTQPTSGWQPGQPVADNHAVFVPPGTPPGAYRLIVALYDPQNGQRLATPAGDALEIGAVTLARPARPLPPEIVPMQQRLYRTVGPLTLVGYDAHPVGFAHAPQTPVQPGQRLRVTLYWQAPDPLPPDWPEDLPLRLGLGGQVVAAPVAGPAYPTGTWPAGEFVRGLFDVPFDGTGTDLWLEVGGERLVLGRVRRADTAGENP